MMILKEAQGWSDSQLFEQCQFNLLVRSALGLQNLDDSAPAASTYYLLRHRIVSFEQEGNENLIEKVFAQVTKSQAMEFNLNGNKIRMDSKLLGSNIAWYSRYELIHETVCMVYRSLKPQIDPLLSESDISLLSQMSEESGDKVSYRNSKSELELKLIELGVIIHKIIIGMNGNSSEALKILGRVFKEQYQFVDDKITMRPKEEISAGSVQSPHDTECHYRKKNKKQVKGYSFNITETCDTGNKLNLVTNVLVDTAGTADCDFLQPAIEATQKMVTQKIETANTDGAYHSVHNQDYCNKNNIDLIIGAIQGKPSHYDLALYEGDNLVVTDLQTNLTVPCCRAASHKDGGCPKWVIKDTEGKPRYFSQKQIDTSMLRKQISARSRSELNVRNNVEASIFQLGYHYPNNKTRYRGLIKHKIWANVRCLWINFVRISNFINDIGPDGVRKTKKQRTLLQFIANVIKFRFVIALVEKFRLICLKTVLGRVLINDFL
jgi:hypothetical protein